LLLLSSARKVRQIEIVDDKLSSNRGFMYTSKIVFVLFGYSLFINVIWIYCYSDITSTYLGIKKNNRNIFKDWWKQWQRVCIYCTKK
jgi:hypothetical protein